MFFLFSLFFNLNLYERIKFTSINKINLGTNLILIRHCPQILNFQLSFNKENLTKKI